MADLQLLRMSEAAQLLAVSRSKVYELARSGALPIVRVGASMRIPRGRLQALLDGQLDDRPGSHDGGANPEA